VELTLSLRLMLVQIMLASQSDRAMEHQVLTNLKCFVKTDNTVPLLQLHAASVL